MPNGVYRRRPITRRPLRRRWTPSRPTVDTTPPTVTFVSQTRSKISRVTGRDSTDIVFTVDEDYQGYQVRVVSSTSATVAQGTQLETGTGGLSDVQRTITVTDDELVAATAAEGSNMLKIFAQDTAGNWSV